MAEADGFEESPLIGGQGLPETLPERKLYGELGLVNLVSLIPSLKSRHRRASVKAGCGKTARPV